MAKNPQIMQLIADITSRHDCKVDEMNALRAHVSSLGGEITFLEEMRKKLIADAGLTEAELRAMVIIKHVPGEAAQAATAEEKNGIKLRSGLITVFDKSGKRSFATPEDYKAGKYPLDEYTPEAIVVRRKNTDEWMEISLVNMYCKDPEHGIAKNEAEVRMPYGGYGKHVEGLIQYGTDERAQVNLDRNGKEYRYACSGFVASSKFVNEGGDKSADPGKRYYYDDEDRYLPLSRLADGTPNPLFGKGKEEPSFLADGVNFESNMKAILSMATAQADWRTAAEIECKSDEGYYPAACCCARFKTPHYDGWGLPTAEDWAIALEDFAEIQEGLKAVHSFAPSLAVPLHEDYGYWSSSEYSSNYAYDVGTIGGFMCGRIKISYYYVRAFRLLRI